MRSMLIISSKRKERIAAFLKNATFQMRQSCIPRTGNGLLELVDNRQRKDGKYPIVDEFTVERWDLESGEIIFSYYSLITAADKNL